MKDAVPAEGMPELVTSNREVELTTGVTPEMAGAAAIEVAKEFHKDLSRKQAQAYAVKIFGPNGFARGKSGSSPGSRKRIGLKSTVPPFRVETIGFGDTWISAISDAATKQDAKNAKPAPAAQTEAASEGAL